MKKHIVLLLALFVKCQITDWAFCRNAKPIILLLIFQLPFAVKLVAQPFSLNENIKPVELKLVNFNPADEKAKGMIAMADITQTKDTLYFFAKGFNIYAPAYTGITAANPAERINIGLYKANWRNADAAGVTDAKGHWEKSFKTEGDYGIMVVPAAVPATYSLVIWTGKEAVSEIPAVLKNIDSGENSGEESVFKKYSYQIMIGLATTVLVLIIFLMKKRKK